MTKQILLVVRIIVFLSFYTPIHIVCMQLSPKNVYKDFQKIHESYDKRFKEFIVQIADDNALEKMNKVERRLQTHKDDLVKEKETAFYTIKKKYKIPDSAWNTYLTVAQLLQEAREEIMWKACEGVTHDITVPQWFVVMLKKELVDLGINPYQINIVNDDKITNMHIKTIGIRWLYEDSVIHTSFGSSGRIIVNSKNINLFDLDAEEGRSLFLAHMLKLSVTCNIISVLRHFSIKVTDTDHSDSFSLERQRVLCAIALKDQRSAQCIKAFCSSLVSKGCCYIDTYKKLSSIDFCWRVRDWLQKYYSNNYHCISLLLKTRERDVAAICDLLDEGMVITKKIVNEVKEKNEELLLKLLLQKTYDEQACCICFEHPEDMRDMPCVGVHIKDFICRKCYNLLGHNQLKQKICPVCQSGCFSYNKIGL